MLETTNNRLEWDRWIAACPEAGPRDGFEYATAAAIVDPGEPGCVRFSSSAGSLLLPLIVRPVPGGHAMLHDAVSPYDFGGYVFGPGSAPEKLLAEFDPVWDQWCARNRIVTEFLRLHPLRSWSSALTKASEVHQMQVVVDLREGYERAAGGFSTNARRSVVRGRRAGVEAAHYEGVGKAAVFHALYAASMRRLNAPVFYDFPLEFFARLFDRVAGVDLRIASVGGSPAAAAVFLHDGPDVFYFLGASEPAHWDRRPNHVLFDDAIATYAAAGKRWLHLGGGSASLMRFKSGFSREIVPYRVRRRIHDPKAYEELVGEAAAAGRRVTTGFFPAYRSHEFMPLVPP